MDKQFKFVLPPPNFDKNIKDAYKPKPHFLTPSGMSLLPRGKQPPPMYGERGPTVPGRFLLQPSENKGLQVAVNPPEKQYCESCELELHSLEDLKRHRAQHEKCPVAGCNYKGHSSVMDKHINALHASGLFEKFKKLSTPEEIAAWREERRKRYPTLANVLLKQKAQEQRQKRGERINSSKCRFGKINDRKRAQVNTPQNKSKDEGNMAREENEVNNKNKKRNRRNKRKQNFKNQNKTSEIQNDAKRDIDKNESETQEIRFGIKMFRGTSQLKDYDHFIYKNEILRNNALFGLVGMYGSDDSDDESDEENNRDSREKQKEVGEIEINHEDQSGDNNRKNIVGKTGFERNFKIDENRLENSDYIQVDNTKFSNERLQLVHDSAETITSAAKCKELMQENLTPNNTASSDLEESGNNFKVITLNGPTTLMYHRNGTIDNVVLDANGNSSDEGPDEVPIQRKSTNLVKMETPSKPISNDEPSIKRSKLEEQPKTLKRKLLIKRKYGLDYRKARLRKQNTMLEKLLEADIRHERNVLLQCVRYVCENNFFGIGQSSQKKSR